MINRGKRERGTKGGGGEERTIFAPVNHSESSVDDESEKDGQKDSVVVRGDKWKKLALDRRCAMFKLAANLPMGLLTLKRRWLRSFIRSWVRGEGEEDGKVGWAAAQKAGSLEGHLEVA